MGRKILGIVVTLGIILVGANAYSSGGTMELRFIGIDISPGLFYTIMGVILLSEIVGLFSSQRKPSEATTAASITASESSHNRPGVTFVNAQSHSVTPQANAALVDATTPTSSSDLNSSEISSIAQSNGLGSDTPNELGAYAADLPNVDDERISKLLIGLQDRMAYKREAVLNEIGREKLTDPRIVGAVEILAVSDRVDTIRDIAKRVLDSLNRTRPTTDDSHLHYLPQQSEATPVVAQERVANQSVRSTQPADNREEIARDMRWLANTHEKEVPILQIMLGILAESLVRGRTQSGERVYPGEIPQLLDQLAFAQRKEGRAQLSLDVQAIAQRIRSIESQPS